MLAHPALLCLRADPQIGLREISPGFGRTPVEDCCGHVRSPRAVWRGPIPGSRLRGGRLRSRGGAGCARRRRRRRSRGRGSRPTPVGPSARREASGQLVHGQRDGSGDVAGPILRCRSHVQYDDVAVAQPLGELVAAHGGQLGPVAEVGGGEPAPSPRRVRPPRRVNRVPTARRRVGWQRSSKRGCKSAAGADQPGPAKSSCVLGGVAMLCPSSPATLLTVTVRLVPIGRRLARLPLPSAFATAASRVPNSASLLPPGHPS